MSSWKRVGGAIALLLALANLPLLVGRDAPNWDASSFFGPSWMLVADHARAGRLLLWNPLVEGGSPDGAHPEFGAFSPLTIVVGALLGGTETAFHVYVVLLWLLAGAGMLLLARHLGAPPWAGFVVACGYVFSGTFTGHFQHTSWLHSYAFVPWVVWRLDAALRGRLLLPAAQAGALLGLSGLAGYPAIVMQTGVLAVFWTAGRFLFPEAEAGDADDARAGRAREGLAAITTLAVVAVMVVSPAWVSFLRESKGYTSRSGLLPREIAVHENALHPGALATFASPYLHSVAALQAKERWAPTDGSSLGCYAGAAIPALALFALGRRRRWAWWVLGMAGFFVASATDALPLRGLLVDVLPWEGYARHGAQRKDFALFLLAVIALLAVRAQPNADSGGAVREPREDGRRFAAGALGIAALGLVSAVAAWMYLGALGPRPAFAVAHFLLAWGGLLAAAWLLQSPRAGGPKLAAGVLVFAAVVDAAGTYRLARVLMVESGRGRETWDRIAKERTSSLDLSVVGLRREAEPPDWTFPRPNRQNEPLKVPVFASYTSLTNVFRNRTSEEPLLARTAVGRDRVWFASSARATPPSETAWHELVGASRAAGSAVLFVHPPASMTGNGDLSAPPGALPQEPAARTGSADILEKLEVTELRYLSEEVTLTVNPPGPGWVLFTDRWARGWKASVHGRAAPLWGGNFIFRAVQVGPGAQTLRFTYRPAGYPALPLASWGTLLVVCLWSVRAARGRTLSISRTATLR
ncbi:MAG: hypothetical protein ACYC4P_15435 [Thermoanaerobaculia bacterium]